MKDVKAEGSNKSLINGSQSKLNVQEKTVQNRSSKNSAKKLPLQNDYQPQAVPLESQLPKQDQPILNDEDDIDVKIDKLRLQKVNQMRHNSETIKKSIPDPKSKPGISLIKRELGNLTGNKVALNLESLPNNIQTVKYTFKKKEVTRFPQVVTGPSESQPFATTKNLLNTFMGPNQGKASQFKSDEVDGIMNQNRNIVVHKGVTLSYNDRNRQSSVTGTIQLQGMGNRLSLQQYQELKQKQGGLKIGIHHHQRPAKESEFTFQDSNRNHAKVASSLTRSYREKWEDYEVQAAKENKFASYYDEPWQEALEERDEYVKINDSVKGKSISETTQGRQQKNELFHKKPSKECLELLLTKGDLYGPYGKNGYQQQITSFIPTRQNQKKFQTAFSMQNNQQGIQKEFDTFNQKLVSKNSNVGTGYPQRKQDFLIGGVNNNHHQSNKVSIKRIRGRI